MPAGAGRVRYSNPLIGPVWPIVCRKPSWGANGAGRGQPQCMQCGWAALRVLWSGCAGARRVGQGLKMQQAR